MTKQDIKAVYVLDGTGLERVDRDVPNYERELFLKGLARGLGAEFDQVDLPLEEGNSYQWSRNFVTCFVAHTPGAREDFIRLCQIVGQTPDDFVYAVSYCEGLVSVHKTYAGALQGLKVVMHEVNPSINLVPLVD